MFKLIIFSIVVFSLFFSSIECQIIVDHSCTDITAIQLQWIEQAKSSLHIAYGHTSHGSQLTDGMTGLVAFANGEGLGLTHPLNTFDWNNGGSDGALDLHDHAMDSDCGNYPLWVNNTTSYLGTPNENGMGSNQPDVNVIIWSWCGQISSKYANNTLHSEYLTPMSNLESTYPGITFVYMTGHVDHWDDANNKAANQTVRNYCIDNEKVLYDFADIECYDPDGEFYEFPHDDCGYYASAGNDYIGNWATAWQNAHVEGEDWYSVYAAHSQPLNGNRKAYAAWWLWARIAGWSGIAPDIPENIEITFTENSVNITWDEVAGAVNYKVYSSDRPNSNFILDTTGIFDNTNWTAPINGIRRFYYIKSEKY
ncbi:MAG: hypothetical protein PHR06_02950 [Candidatus Cloacimonetes bacterium]|nr:hypothetical protein [Candidatus Cloacimonadota bacterium]